MADLLSTCSSSPASSSASSSMDESAGEPSIPGSNRFAASLLTPAARAWADDPSSSPSSSSSEDAGSTEDEDDDRAREEAARVLGQSPPAAAMANKKGALKKVEPSALARGKENQRPPSETQWSAKFSDTVLTPRGSKRKQPPPPQPFNSQTQNQTQASLTRTALQPLARKASASNTSRGRYDGVAISLPSYQTPTPKWAHAPSLQHEPPSMRMKEHTPLLRPLVADDPEWGFCGLSESRPNLKDEFLSLCVLSYPVIFTYVLEFLPGIASMTLVGHMDSPKTKEYVDGVSLSTMFMNLTGVAFGFGLATAMDTLCSQAYGAGKPMKMGIYFQCGVLVLGVTIIPVFLLNWYTETFLLWMGQPEEVAALAGRFSRLVLPGIPFLYIYELFKKLLQAQNVVAPMVYIAVLSNVVNVVFGVYLTWYTPLGYDGAAIARTVANVVLPAALIPFFVWNPQVARTWWPGWKLAQAIRYMKTFLTLGIPGMFMMLLEWWAFEIMAVFVGLLPNSIVAISVHSVLSNVSTMTFNFFLGIGVATNIRVGNYVGSNQPEHAKMASALGIVLALLVSAALAVVVLVTRNVLPMVFINDETAVTLAAHAFLCLLPYQMLDAVNSVMQGVFRGTGRQKLGAYINLFGYFVVGLPFGVYLAFKWGYGVEGLWLGLTAGIGIAVAMSMHKIYYIDWNEMTDAARVRTS